MYSLLDLVVSLVPMSMAKSASIAVRFSCHCFMRVVVCRLRTLAHMYFRPVFGVYMSLVCFVMSLSSGCCCSCVYGSYGPSPLLLNGCWLVIAVECEHMVCDTCPLLVHFTFHPDFVWLFVVYVFWFACMFSGVVSSLW